MYEYSASVLRVVDGDTVHLAVDLGFDVTHRVTARLSGINAPEKGTPEGRLAADWLTRLVAFAVTTFPPPLSIPVVGWPVVVRTDKDRREKYGRYLVRLWRAGEDLSKPSINERMVAAGHAVEYHGEARHG